ncbi:MAG TPA: antibiotic biosynthesis monooxygenase [Stellaceae bacterium]|nr:antibiotic biosynthesis monooxygenase [Stellaceae bacterium]
MFAAGRSLFVMMALVMAQPALAQAPANAPAQPAPATSQQEPAASGPQYVVAYFETAPAAADATARVLRRFAAETHRAAGNQGILALHEARRPGRFVLVETWRDQAALEAGGKALEALSASLQTRLIAPFDIRPCVALDVAGAAPGSAAPAPRSLYVLTHVDVVPSFKDQTIDLVKQLAAAARQDPGNEVFDPVQQGNRPNHMFLVEGWRDRAAFDAYVATEPARTFRGKLLPMQGALYDERLYDAIR